MIDQTDIVEALRGLLGLGMAHRTEAAGVHLGSGLLYKYIERRVTRVEQCARIASYTYSVGCPVCGRARRVQAAHRLHAHKAPLVCPLTTTEESWQEKQEEAADPRVGRGPASAGPHRRKQTRETVTA